MPPTPRRQYAPTVHVLTNGIPVVIDHVSTVDSCAVGIWVRAGTRDEPRGHDGVAHLVEHTVFRRTATRTAARIAREFEDVGAYTNAYTTKEETCYYVRTLRQHLPRVVATLADVVLSPSFVDTDIDKERRIIVEEIRSYEDDAEEYIFDIGERQMFGSHPLGTPIVGSVDVVSSIPADAVRAFHGRHYHAGSIVLTVSGNVEADDFLAMAEAAMAAAPAARRRSVRRPPPLRPTADVIERRSVQQAHILWQFRTGGHATPERHALMLLNTILGDGMTSRLNVRIREHRGLAYSVYSQLQLFADCGSFAIYAGVEDTQRERVEAMIDRELTAVVASGVRPSELRRAKEQLRASKLMSLESLTARMTMLGKGMLEDRTPEDPYALLEAIDGVHADDIGAATLPMGEAGAWARCLLIPSGRDDG